MAYHSGTQKLSSYGRFGILLIIIGGLLALDVIAGLSFLYKLWPLLVLILGIGFVGIYLRRSRSEGTYLAVGTYLIEFSALSLYCSLFSWSVLATLWPLFICFLGISIVLGYIFGKQRPFMLLAGLLFISLSVVFFFVFSLSSKLWWSVFILVGITFFVFDKARRL